MTSIENGSKNTLKSNTREIMLISFPIVLLMFSSILFVQSVFFYFTGSCNSNIPVVISILISILYLIVFIYLRKRAIKKYHGLFISLWLFLFYLTELILFIFFNITVLWVILLLFHILCGFYILDNKYFIPVIGIFVVIFIVVSFRGIVGLEPESVLIEFFSLSISCLLYFERRRMLLKLEKLYSSQNEIEVRFKQLEENIRQVYIICSVDFYDYFYISSGFEKMFSIPRAEFTDKSFSWKEFIHPGDLERVNLEMLTASVDFEYREFDFRTLNNNITKWLNIKLFPVADEKSYGNKSKYVLIVENIDEIKKAELELAKAKSLEAELAAKIQRDLLFSRTNINIPLLDIAADSIPSLTVGGDFYDFYCFSDSIVDLIIADVMGKGIIASMLGAASKNVFLKARLDLTVTENKIPEIDCIMSLADSTLSPELVKMGKFVTLQYGRLNLVDSTFSFIDCGHTSLFYYCARQKCCWSIKGRNMPLGFNPGEILISSIIPYENNDFFFFYSDGITETENEEGEQFGEKRLNYILNSSSHLTANQIVNKVKNLVFHYSSSDGFADDVTCIALNIGTFQNKSILKNRIFHGIRESLSDVRVFTSLFLNEYCPEFPNEVIYSIILALNEAAANIIEHNYEKEEKLKGNEFLIEAGRNEFLCFFRLYYNGIDFDWTIIESPKLNEFRSGGYGLYLMNEIMDSICFSRNIDEVQCLNLVKYFKI